MLLVGRCQTSVSICVSFCHSYLQSHMSLLVGPFMINKLIFRSSFLCNDRELHLQIKLIGLQSLLSEAQHEPRLKGPFPVVLYRQILTSLQRILDKLHSMRCVTTREEWLVFPLLILFCGDNILFQGIRQVQEYTRKETIVIYVFAECPTRFYCASK